MAKYCVNKNTDVQGDHEVHKYGCPWYPDAQNRIDLGECHTCHEAVRKAKKHYDNVNGHKYCCPSCHTT